MGGVCVVGKEGKEHVRCVFLFKQKTADEMLRSLVGSEMCIRDSPNNIPSSTGPEKSRVNPAGPPAKPKYSLVTDSGQVP